MGSAARKNLQMFRQLCGDNNLKNVRIVTTNWKQVKGTEGNDREAELANGPFKLLIEHGAKMLPHDGMLESARSIVSEFVPMAPVKLKIQEELEAGRALGDTSAGAVILEEMKEAQRKHEEEMEDLRKEMEEGDAADEDLRAELAEERRRLEEMMAQMERERNILGLARQIKSREEAKTIQKGVEEYLETARKSTPTPPQKIHGLGGARPDKLGNSKAGTMPSNHKKSGGRKSNHDIEASGRAGPDADGIGRRSKTRRDGEASGDSLEDVRAMNHETTVALLDPAYWAFSAVLSQVVDRIRGRPGKR